MDDLSDAREVYHYEPDPYFTYRVSPRSIWMGYCTGNATGLTRTVFPRSFYHNIPHHYQMYMKRAIPFTESGNPKMTFICKEKMGPSTFLWYDFFRNQYEIIQLNQQITERVSLVKGTNRPFYLNDKKDRLYHGLVLGTKQGPIYLVLFYRDQQTQQMKAEVERIPLELQDGNRLSCIEIKSDVVKAKDSPRIILGCQDGSVYLYQFTTNRYSSESNRLKKTAIDLSDYVEYKKEPIASLTSCTIFHQTTKLVVAIGQNKPSNSDEFSVLDACVKVIWIAKFKPADSTVIYPPLVESTSSLTFIAMNLFITDDKRLTLGAVMSSGSRQSRNYTLKMWEIENTDCQLMLDLHLPIINVESRYLYRMKHKNRRSYLELNYQLLVENILKVPYTTTIDNMYFSGEITALAASRKDKLKKQKSSINTKTTATQRIKKSKKLDDDSLILNEGPSTSKEKTPDLPRVEAYSGTDSDADSEDENTTQNDTTEQSNSEHESTNLDTSIEMDSDVDFDLDDGGYSPPAFISSLSDIADLTFSLLDEGAEFLAPHEDVQLMDHTTNAIAPELVQEAFSINATPIDINTTSSISRNINIDIDSDPAATQKHMQLDNGAEQPSLPLDPLQLANMSTYITKNEIDFDEDILSANEVIQQMEENELGQGMAENTLCQNIYEEFQTINEEETYLANVDTVAKHKLDDNEAIIKTKQHPPRKTKQILVKKMTRREKARIEAEEKARLQAEEEENKHKIEEEEARIRAGEQIRLETEAMELKRKAEETETKRKTEEEARIKAEAEEQARYEAELDEAKRKAEEQARIEEEVRIKTEAEEKARLEAEEAEAKRKAEAEEQARIEEEARIKAEAEEKARLEEEARIKAEAKEKARLEEEARIKTEAEEKARLEAEGAEAKRKAEAEEQVRVEEEARIKAETEEKARLEEEARIKTETEEKARLEEARIKAEVEEKARLEAEAEAKRIAEAEEQARIEEEARIKAEVEEKARLEAEAEAKRKAEAEEQARIEEARIKAESEEKARLEETRIKAEAEEKARLEAEEAEAKHKAEAEEQARVEEEARIVAEAEEKARLEAEEAEAKRKAEAEEKARLEEEARIKTETEEKARLEEARIKAEVEEKARLEAEAEAKRIAEAEEQARIEEEARIKGEAEEKARLEEEARIKAESEEKARLEEARFKAEAEEKTRLEAEEAEAKRKAEAEEQARIEEEARIKAETEEKARLEKARIKAEVEEQTRREAEVAEAKCKAEAKEQARLQEETRIKAEVEEMTRLEEEARIKAEVAAAKEIAEEEAKILLEAEEQARREAELAEAKRIAEEEQARIVAEEQTRFEIEAKRKAEEEEHTRIKAEEQVYHEAEAKRKAEEEEAEVKRKIEESEARSIIEGLICYEPEEVEIKHKDEEGGATEINTEKLMSYETKKAGIDNVVNREMKMPKDSKNEPSIPLPQSREIKQKCTEDISTDQSKECKGKNMSNDDSVWEKTPRKRAIDAESSYQSIEKKLKRTEPIQAHYESRWSKHYNKRIVEDSLHRYSSTKTIKDALFNNLKPEEENGIGSLCWESDKLDLKLFLLDYCIKNKQNQTIYLTSRQILQGINQKLWQPSPEVIKMCQDDCRSVENKIHPVLRKEIISANPFTSMGKAEIRQLKWRNSLGDMYNFICKT